MKKRDKIIYWVSTVWLGLGMASTGVAQLSKMKTGAGGADIALQLGYPLYFLTLLGVWKMAGVIAVLIPKYPLLKEWAYAGFFFAMSGAVFSHIVTGHPGELFPALLLLVLTIVSWYFRPDDRRTSHLSANQNG